MAHERTKHHLEELTLKLNNFQEERDHVRNMARVEFEQKLSDFSKIKNENEELKKKLEALKSDGENEKLEYGKKVQILTKELNELQKELQEHQKLNQQLRLDEKKRAQGLMEAVKLFVSAEHTECVNQQVEPVENITK